MTARADEHDQEIPVQAILKAFDFERTVDDPYLSPANATAALATHWDIDASEETVGEWMDQLVAAEQLFKKDLGMAGLYRPLVAPALSAERARISDDRQETGEEAFLPLETDVDGVRVHPEVKAWIQEQDQETTQLIRDELADATDDPAVALKPLRDRATEKLKLGHSEYRAELSWDSDALRVIQIGRREEFYAD